MKLIVADIQIFVFDFLGIIAYVVYLLYPVLVLFL